MNKKIKLVIIAIVFVLFLVGSYTLYHQLSTYVKPSTLGTNHQENSEITEGDSSTANDAASDEEKKLLAPDFTVVDINGNEVNLSDFIGKPIILNFWASWCGPCKSEMPDFNESYNEYQEDIHFLMVNMTDGYRETVEIAHDHVKEQGYAFPVYYDTESDAATTYGVRSLPTTYFIDADGYMIAQAMGAIDSDTLQKGIDLISP